MLFDFFKGDICAFRRNGSLVSPRIALRRSGGNVADRRLAVRLTAPKIDPVSNSRLVYSTGDGDRRRRETDKQRSAQAAGPQLPNDGVVRIFREKGARGGKSVTVVRGLPAGDLNEVGSDLKRHCGSGGTVKNGAVEIQGDHREKVAARLRSRGYTVKLAGG
jgi:translation initiation factor 1